MSTCIAPRCPAPREVGALFCGVHMTAPPGQRGGWLSAYKRRLKMGNDKEQALDAHCVWKRLWVGSKPPFDRDLPSFQMLVFCAAEIQPPHVGFRGSILRCRLRDDYPTDYETRLALLAGQRVASCIASGKTVLVTCSAGMNRSALVAGLAIGLMSKATAPEIMARIRETRHPSCLYNKGFQELLNKYVGSGRPKPSGVDT